MERGNKRAWRKKIQKKFKRKSDERSELSADLENWILENAEELAGPVDKTKARALRKQRELEKAKKALEMYKSDGNYRCFCPLPNCNYTGSHNGLRSHARSAHSEEADDLIPFVFDSPCLFNLNFGKKKVTVVLQEEKEGALIVVQGFKGSQGAYISSKRKKKKIVKGFLR